MNIKLMLARLQSALGNQDLVEQMVLVPEPTTSTNEVKSTKSINLVVGYNGSFNSQAALDIALWIAHQTRLATQKQVKVHVVYVLDQHSNKYAKMFNLVDISSHSNWENHLDSRMCASRSTTSVLTQPRPQALATQQLITKVDLFDQADQILWQARRLAEEWKGAFTAHLRFGEIAAEIREVVQAEAADLLLLGCNSTKHRIVRQLSANFPCSVLGIPPR